MLVVRKLIGKTKYLIMFQAYDTETGETYNTTSADVKDRKVFGLLSDTVAVPVSDMDLKLLSFIDSPIEVDSVGMTDYRQINARCITNGVDVILFYPSALSTLDEDLIFWNDGRYNITILDIYRYVFLQPIKYTSDMNVYVVCSSYRKTYKLDMNKKVISFMQKVVVLC